jgi:hypothetical protein
MPQPVLAGVTLPYPQRYIALEQPRAAPHIYLGATVDYVYRPDLALSVYEFTLSWLDLTVAEITALRTAYAAISAQAISGSSSVTYTDVLGTSFTVVLHPKNRTLDETAHTAPDGTLLWDTTLHLLSI